MRLTFLLLATLIGAVSSAADLSHATEVQALIQTLQRGGLQKVGGLDLATLSKQVDQITWKTTDQALPKPADSEPGWEIVQDSVTGQMVVKNSIPIPSERDRPYRQSGRYDPVTKTVTLDLTDLKAAQSANSVEQLKLHEALGALGYNDKQYSTSMALMILESAPDLQTRKDLATDFGRGILSPAALQGGTSIGGGGDVTAIEIKNQVLQSLKASGRAFTKEFLLKYPTIDFEPLSDPKNQIVFFDYKVRLKRDSNTKPGTYFQVRENPRYEELATIFFPMQAWKVSARNRKLVVELIKTSIQSYVPVYRDTPVEKVGVRSCPGVIYTAPVDPWETLPGILSWRAGAISGCQNTWTKTVNSIDGFEAGIQVSFLPPQSDEVSGNN